MNQTINCPRLEKTISLLNQHWTALIIKQIDSSSGSGSGSGSQQFCALQSSIGISEKRFFIRTGIESNRKLVSVMGRNRVQKNIKVLNLFDAVRRDNIQ